MSLDQSESERQPSPPLEIERKFLLRGRPTIPSGAERLRMEQGYIRPAAPAPGNSEDPFRLPPGAGGEGRLRRTVYADGSVRCFHTIKRGEGLVREEHEREIDLATFERHWPRTEGQRLRKTRWRVRDGALVWEIDEIDDLEIILAEVELPRADAPAPLPAWLAPHVEREVTDDPRYTNHALALECIARLRGS